MMRGVASASGEASSACRLLDEALEAAVKLSHRYIPARQLPDKAVSLLDTACARVAISQHAVPAEVEDCRRRIEALETELEILGREEAIGMDAGVRRASAEEKLAANKNGLAGSKTRWDEEGAGRPDPRLAAASCAGSKPVDASAVGPSAGNAPTDARHPAAPTARRGGLQRRRRRRAKLTPEERAKLLAELKELQAELQVLQGESPADPARASTSRPSPPSSPTGPAFPSAAW